MSFKIRVTANYVISSKYASLHAAQALRHKMAEAAQRVYDDWVLDEDGNHWEVGGGGICHLIADEIVEVLSSKGIDAATVSANDEVHVYVVAAFEEGVYSIDIPHRIYETGGGYSWKKIEGVTFTSDDVVFYKIDDDPENLEQYIET